MFQICRLPDRNYVTVESRFSHNAQFYTTPPVIFLFLKSIIEQQSVNYIKIRYIDEQAPQSRIEKEKLGPFFEMWAKYQSGQITRAKFVHLLGFKYQAKTDL